ncbi:exocyst complex component EXO70A1 [Physcomitrium patens]|uniref:Exocyst subunit Exo70 family protein n=1 Tax=Physcomitrium patens TaxID=3218 RepID=A9SN89_PHYPA|nr:exocyst complex component EXO70A1-like isoform X2 [Physcomitrium patens]PNR51667.1 hypothetical protein PHYPA_010855 [Physcomitrium patens]|eukprot:XP_024381441.1 exocyst complex component EXO70A1-like isoform X2 [Physcomitrella patens]
MSVESAEGAKVAWPSLSQIKTVAQASQDGLAKLLAARSALCQSLEKSRAIGNQLGQSDKRLQTSHERLPSVRKALAPLEGQSKIVEGLAQRINKTLEPAMQVLSMFDVVKKIRVRLMREPRDDFDSYMSALVQLEDAVDYLNENSSVAIKWLQEAVSYLNEAGSTDTVRLDRLNESLTFLKSQQEGGTHEIDGGLLLTAFGKLEKEFKRLLHEHRHPISLPERIDNEVEESPSRNSEVDYLDSYTPEVLERLQAIISKLVGYPHYQRCMYAYQDVRSSLCEESLQTLDVSYLNYSTTAAVDTVAWDDLQVMIHKWCEHFKIIVKILYAGEKRLAREVFKFVGHSVWVECLRNLAENEMDAFMRFGLSVVRGERYPEKLSKLLEMFECLEMCEPSVNQVFDGEVCVEIRSRHRELMKQVVVASDKTFRSIQGWIKMQREFVTFDARVMPICSFVVNYLKLIIGSYVDPLRKVLRIAHSWADPRALVSGSEDEDEGLSQGIAQILRTLEEIVEARAREVQDPALRHIFLMNNMYYIRTRVKNSEIGPLLGEDLMSGIGRKVSQNALKYQQECWRPVLQHLSREGLTGSGSSKGHRDLVRQRLKAFNAAFDETIQIQSKWIIPDQNLRDGTLAAVTQMVVPAYRSFMSQFGPLLESRLRDPDKYVKYSAEMLETILGALFLGNG